MLRSFLISLVLMPGMALSHPLCADMLSGDARLGSEDATCQVSLLQNGAEQETCHWAYLAHEGHAERQFLSLATLTRHCLGENAGLPPEPGVNHPDSFKQLLFEGQGWHVSLSLKEKNALGQSLVFFGLSRAP